MNKIIVVSLTILITAQLFGQTEFETYRNGLIYSETTMNKLRQISDSLNLKYKTCDFDKVFYSKSQTIGHIVRLDSRNIKQAKVDMDNKISFDDFVLKYPNATIEKNVLVVKHKYENYRHEEVVEFGEVDLNGDYGFEIRRDNKTGIYDKSVKKTWLYEYHKKTKDSEASIDAFYFPEDFKNMPLTTSYSRQIGYADCLIDTMATKFKHNAKEGWVDLPENWQTLSAENKQKLLDKMRSTRVVGGCSQDRRPREHAVNIAILSAETTNWEVFLKSHLDIMNDRFDRLSDGSYAYAERKTYIKELEELNINVLDLLIGISLRVENPAKNHYHGNIGRLGRAISETGKKEDFETQMLSMVEDTELDDYNRIIAYFLFISYNHFITNKDEKKNNMERIRLSIKKLPDYLRDKILFKTSD